MKLLSFEHGHVELLGADSDHTLYDSPIVCLSDVAGSYCQILWIAKSKRRRTLGENLNHFSQLADEAKEYATMEISTSDTAIVPLPTSRDVLTEILRRGSTRLLAQAVEEEVEDWIEGRRQHRDAEGRQQVVRNGYAPARTILTGLGP